MSIENPEVPAVPVSERRQYRVEVLVPNVARSGSSWKLLTTADSYADAGDIGDYLLSSLVASGIDRDQARHWVETRLGVRTFKTEAVITSGRESMPIGP